MSFYISLSGLKAAQTDLSAISNNVANVNSNGFKKNVANFGDIFSSAPFQNTASYPGQGVRVQSVTQQFTQGTTETTGKTLDLAITGEGFFTVKNPVDGLVSYTRDGALSIDKDRNVLDRTGARLQVLAVDSTTGEPTANSTKDKAALTDLNIPSTLEDGITQLTSVAINAKGVVSAVYTNGETRYLGAVAMASFNGQDALRQQGNQHWTQTVASGDPTFGVGNQGLFGAVNSGSLERANVDITEELVELIAAQRNFQANAKAIEAANTLTTTVVNMRT